MRANLPTRAQGNGRVARIVGLERRQYDEVPAARGAHGADHFRFAVEAPGLRLQPAHAEIDIGHRARIGRLGRIAEFQRRHHHAATGDGLVDGIVAGIVAQTPGTAMRLDHRRKRTLAARPENAGEKGLFAMTQVLDFLDLDRVGTAHRIDHDTSPRNEGG